MTNDRLQDMLVQASEQGAARALARLGLADERASKDSLGGQGGGGGLLNSLGSILGSVLGAPGRATGGPVSPGRAYRVGERGPELFVPTAAGRIETGGGGGPAHIALTIHVSDNGRGSAPDALQRSSRHVARAVRAALARD